MPCEVMVRFDTPLHNAKQNCLSYFLLYFKGITLYDQKVLTTYTYLKKESPDLSARAKNKVGNAQTHLTEVTRVNFQNKEVEK